MVMSSVDLADRLIMEELEEDKIIIETNKAFLPIDKRNNVYQAASIVKKRYGINKGILIRITKKYPCSSRPWRWQYRLCSSAKGMDRLWQLGLTMPELIDIGMEVGTDVPCAFMERLRSSLVKERKSRRCARCRSAGWS